jgi:hypothetical protein
VALKQLLGPMTQHIIGVMQSIGQTKGENMKHKILIINENDRYFATTHRGEDNSPWYF